MGTKALTRIQKNGDCIDIYTSSDGFPPEMKETLEDSLNNWKSLAQYTKQRIKEKGLNLINLDSWADDVLDWVNKIEENPRCEDYATLFCNVNLNKHSVLPFEESKNYDYDSDVVMSINDKNDFSYEEKSISNDAIKEKPVSDEYFMVRISNTDSTKGDVDVGPHNLDNFKFIDLKVKGSKSDFNRILISLPIFFLELHSTVRFNNKKDYEENCEIYHKNEILRGVNNYILQSFYSPNNDTYIDWQESNSILQSLCIPDNDIDTGCEDTDMSGINSEKSNSPFESIEDLMQNIIRMIPLNFDASRLASYLYFAKPGVIEPMTNAEQLWAKKQSADKFLQVSIYDGRLSYISFKEDKIEMNEEWLHEYFDYVKYRFYLLLKQLNPNFKHALAINYGISNNRRVVFPLEKSLLSYFHLLTSIDHNLNP